MKSLGVRLWLIMISLVMFILLLLWFFQITFLEQFYINARINDVKDEIKIASKIISEKDENLFYDELEKIAFDRNVYIEIIDVNHHVIFSGEAQQSSSKPPMMRNSTRSISINEALQEKESMTTLVHPRFSTKFILIGMPVSIDNIISALVVTMPVAPVEDTAEILKQQLVYISIILLFTGMIIAIFISRSLTKPIVKIKEVAEKITTGNFNNRLDINRKDEIGILADTINNMSDELSKVENLRKELIANVSHELRTPLSIIQGYAETVRDVTWSEAEKRDNALNIIIEESQRLSNIVNDILNLSLLESDNFELELDKFSLSELLDSAYNKYSVLKEKMKITLNIDVKNETIVYADKKRIEQVLYNVINNAFNHTESGGTISIKTIADESIVKILIVDTGTGISKEGLKHIWERFYKGSNEKVKKLPSTGLGLAIVKNILQAHDVLFGVESVEGEGTTFWFNLKIEKDKE